MAKKKSKPAANPNWHMTVEVVSLDTLHHDPANVRTHNDRNLTAITASLKEFGQVEPLVVQSDTGKVIGGNGRLTAMLAMGMTEAAIVRVDATDAKAAALGIALNRTASLAEWDDDALAKVLGSLDVDMQLAAGFDEGELEKLLGRPVDPNATGGDPGDGRYVEQHAVIVTCADEAEQARVYEELKAGGYACRVVST